MSLKEYREKRDFSKTSEPKGSNQKAMNKQIFVVQEHNATRLHWDLRLEMGGVLKSWAVPKGPPLEIGVKRLAVQVEDHPLDYAKFEGTIPNGMYGAGTVEIWDNGTYEPTKISEDKIMVIFNGKKLKGPYVMIKTRFAKNSWLLFKTKE